MKRIADLMARAWRLARQNTRVLGALLFACVVVLAIVGVRAGTAPQRQITQPFALSTVGGPEVLIQIMYPAYLTAGAALDKAMPITVIAKAQHEIAVAEILVALTRPDESVAFVDATGRHISGRVLIAPGYPDPAYADLLVVHGDVQTHSRLLGAVTVMVTPMVWVDDQPLVVPELQFPIKLESPSGALVRHGLRMLATAGLPLLALVALIVLGSWGWRQYVRRRRLRREQRLSTVYLMLREHIKLDQWQDARKAIDQLRLEQSRYRDLDQLDTLVSAAETAGWRRDQLYQSGLQAYKRRDWPNAVQAFRTIETETPYHRDVRFLRRTAALYADLTSRDRSLRLAAARELGEVADLVDRVPLLDALGDRSAQVADAAETAFAQIGADGFDTLLQGLVHVSADVRRRSYGLIESMGQDVREQLLNALHSPDAALTGPVAMLLANLGAREELGSALLWAQPVHHQGIVKALCTEGLGSGAVLVQILLDAPEAKVDIILAALAALKMVEPVDRRLEDALRATRDPDCKRRLKRALGAGAEPFRADEDAGHSLTTKAPLSEASQVRTSSRRHGPRLRLLGGGRS